MAQLTNLITAITQGEIRALARAISLVENELDGHEELLQNLPTQNDTHVVGITGPPGAGKSTLINALLHFWTQNKKRVAVLSVDPSSPFNYGALLGDRVRMSDFYTNELVFIRSIASRGSLGGLSAKIIEICDVVRAANFDYIIIETVGVGQSEVEIAGIADTTVVTVVPEAGDEVQTMKAGVMEIADIFVVNKSDRPNASIFIKNLKLLAHTKATQWEIPVVKAVATTMKGIEELAEHIALHKKHIDISSDKKLLLLTEKAYQLIQQKRMRDIDKKELTDLLKKLMNAKFNLYAWVNSKF